MGNLPQTGQRESVENCQASNVIIFPKTGWNSSKDGMMKEIDAYKFYEIGNAVHSLNRMRYDMPVSEAINYLFPARIALNQLLSGELVELMYCRQETLALHRMVNDVLKEYVFNDQGEVDFRKDFDAKIDGFHIWGFEGALQKFENNFAAEMRNAATYYVPRLGLYNTSQLVNGAEAHLPSSAVARLGEEGVGEFRAAGRCLAFDLWTAAGFHALRAVELVIDAYYKAFAGPEATDKKTWGDYVEALRNLSKSVSPGPSKKTVRILDQIRDMDRNPLMHPRDTLDETDARVLFDLGSSAIVAMVSEMDHIEEGQGSLDLLVPIAQRNVLAQALPQHTDDENDKEESPEEKSA